MLLVLVPTVQHESSLTLREFRAPWFTVDSKTVEHECRMNLLVFFLSFFLWFGVEGR